MKQGIVIVTWSGGKAQFETLINSIKDTHYPIIVVVNDAPNADNAWLSAISNNYLVFQMPWDGFELGAIQTVLQNTVLDEFILLQDTFEILDISIFDILFNNYPGQSVAYNPHFQMYLGKFRREVLKKLSIPEVRNKIDAIRQEEQFTNAYKAIEPVVIFNPSFRDENFYGSWEERWGRKNLVLRDQYLIKRKGTWDANQLIKEDGQAAPFRIGKVGETPWQ